MNQMFSISKKELDIQRKKHLIMMAKMQEIKLVIFDVDGVLTDGRIYYGESGEEIFKVFNVKDGSAFKALHKKNIELAVISGRDSKPLRARMEELNVKYCYFGSCNKLSDYKKLRNKLKLKDREILFVGDDVIDIDVMKKVGISLAPADAHQLVQRTADATLSVEGGSGIAQLILEMFLMAENYSEKEKINDFENFSPDNPLRKNIH